MSALTTFTIKDGSATPADVTYSPEKVTAEETQLFDRRLESRDLQPSLFLKWSAPTNARKTYRAGVTSGYPLVRLIAGENVAPNIGRADSNFVLPTMMTEQERKHLFAMHVNAVQHILFKDVIYKLDPVRG